MKKFILCLSVIILTICLTGCMGKTERFEGKGVSIVLPSDFEVVETEKWDFYVENDEVAIMSNRLGRWTSIEDANGNKISLSILPLKTYYEMVLTAYKLEVDTYFVEGYRSTFYYCYYTVGEDYGYMMMVAATEGYFYTINLCVDYGVFQESKQQLLEYAISIELE